MADLIDEIEDRAKEPAEARGDVGSMVQHLLPDQIAAAKFVESQKVAKSGGLGIRFARIMGPSPIP